MQEEVVVEKLPNPRATDLLACLENHYLSIRQAMAYLREKDLPAAAKILEHLYRTSSELATLEIANDRVNRTTERVVTHKQKVCLLSGDQLYESGE